MNIFQTSALDLNDEIFWGRTTQGETYIPRNTATCERRPYRPFSGEESSYVAIIQSLSVSLLKSKSSANFTEADNLYYFYIDYSASANHVNAKNL